MKVALFALFGFLVFQGSYYTSLVGSIWAYKVTETCNNTLKFKSNDIVLEYDCELDYTFHSTYKLASDTLIIKGKDDSHSEDHGKITSYWINTYLIKNKALYAIRSQELVNDKWKDRKIKNETKPDYIRTK